MAPQLHDWLSTLVHNRLGVEKLRFNRVVVVSKNAVVRIVESTLQINFETQQKDVVVGTWTAGQFKQRFVCAQLNPATWSCLDATGRASIEATSASEIKVCYLDSRQGALGAGCALLKKAG